MAERPDYDQRLKRLLTDAHDGFLELIAPGTVWREELPEELPAPGRRPARRVLEIGQYQLWPLSALMAGSSIESILEMGERIAQAPIPYSERAELAGLLFSLGGLRHKKPSLMHALRRKRMLDELLDESEVTQEYRKRGLEQGKAEGKAEGERLAVVTVLEARFGSVSEDVRAALEGVPVEELPALVAAAAIAPLEQVRTRLGLS